MKTIVMKKLVGLIVLFCSLSTFSNAQLSVGDIAFIGYNTDSGTGSNDNF